MLDPEVLIAQALDARYILVAFPAEDDAAWYRITHALDAFAALNAIANHEGLRSLLKHGDPEERFKGSITEALCWFQEEVWNAITDYGIDMERGYP